MVTEFVCVVSSGISESNDEFEVGADCLHGSLIKEPYAKCVKMGDIGSRTCWLYTVQYDCEETAEACFEAKTRSKILFDGEAVFQGVHSRNHTVKDYYEFSRSARGSFCVLSFTKTWNDDIFLKATNDPLGLYPLLFIKNEEYTIITNNPLLAESLSWRFHGISLVRSRDHVVNEIVTQTPLDIGPYKGMEYVAFDKELIVSAKKVFVKDKRGSDFYYNNGCSFDELLEDAANEIRENISAIAASEYSHRISDITGGIDSRMILAAILGTDNKNNFKFFMSGKYPNPDANVADYIIEKFGLEKCRISDPAMRILAGSYEEDAHRYIKTFCYASSGMKNNVARHVSSKTNGVNIFRVGGGFSAYKANYSKKIKASGNLDLAVEKLTKGDFLIPDDELALVKGRVRSILFDWTVHDSMSLESALDRFHVEHRGRFHIGVCEHWGRYQGGKAHPLNSPSLVRASFSVSDSERISDVVTFRLMYKLYPELVFVPLESRVWNPKAYELFGDDVKNRLSQLLSIDHESNKLYKKLPEVKLIRVSHRPSEFKSKSDVVISEWKREQVSLRRKRFWTELDKVKEVFSSLYVCYKEQGFPGSPHLDRLSNKDLYEYASIKEVLELHCMTTWLSFFLREEMPVRV